MIDSAQRQGGSRSYNLSHSILGLRRHEHEHEITTASGGAQAFVVFIE